MSEFKQSVARNIPLIYTDAFLRGFNIYAAIFIIYVGQVFGSYMMAMSLFAITQISAVVSELPSGIMSDKLGRKWTQVSGAVCGFLGVLCYAAGTGFSVFAAGAILLGIADAMFSGNEDALLYDTLKQNNKSEEFQKYKGRIGSLDQTSLGISAVVSSGVVLLWGLHAAVIATAIPMFLSIIVCLFIIEPTVHKKTDTNIFAHLITSFKQVFKNKKLRLLLFGHAISWGFGETMYQFSAAFYKSLVPAWTLGYFRAATNICAAIGNFISHRITKIIGPFRTVFHLGLVSQAIFLAAILMANVWTLFIKQLNAGIWGIRLPARMAIMQAEFTDKERATMGNIVAFVGSLSFGLCSIFIGWIADIWSPYIAMITAGSLTFLSYPFIYKALKPKNK
jgi:MFS family permease